MRFSQPTAAGSKGKVFYGWYIVAVGFLAQVNCAFHMSSTLSGYGPSTSAFFLYGIGLGGSFVLQELIWATYFGRRFLGTVRGLGIFVTYAFGAAGAPFFGFLHDLTASDHSSFLAFVVAVVLSAILSAPVRPFAKAARR